MVTTADTRYGTGEQTLVVDLPFPGEVAEPPEYTRVDIVLEGVDHSEGSYEIRLYLNNPDASFETPRDPEQGYAGRLSIFGHGGCFGDDGHCEVPEPSTDPTDLRPLHHLTPLDSYITVTDAVRRIVQRDGGLRTVTLVPVSTPPRKADAGPAPDLLAFRDVSLRTYLTPDDAL